jgi:predicted CXXCH cytochrome family protein
MRKLKIFQLLIVLCLPFLANSQSIVNTVHNLSVSGPGTIKATTESEVCIFCHTAHNSSPKSPLWNRTDPGLNYILYDNTVSSSFQAVAGQPDGSSVLCLSCHDGTIALGKTVSRKEEISFSGGITTMPLNKNNLRTDLSDDHPISFIYDPALAGKDGQLKSIPSFPTKLDKNSKVQCTSCHNPHKNDFKNFLSSSNKSSALCITCHDRTNWTSSSHQSSTAIWSGTGKNPWQHIDEPFVNVSQNGCENCHNTHNANGKAQLMKSQLEENNCLDCHNGNVARTNLEADFVKSYTHGVFNYNGIHNSNEKSIPTAKHVECADCHNSHSTNSKTANAPYANGFISGVKGIDQNGIAVNSIQYEYELCYRCHSLNAFTPSSTIRNIEQNNVRLEFNTSNPSFHPVAGVGNNNNVPSLISPLTTSSMIYCTDCHASNGTSASGPHGSIYPQILKYKYETIGNPAESYSSYELCYSCHNRNSILNNDSFKEHNKHIRDENTSCNICHDPHGISNSQGNSINNSNLINFDTKIVSSDATGNLKFVDTGNNSGYCIIKCHGKTHTENMSY